MPISPLSTSALPVNGARALTDAADAARAHPINRQRILNAPEAAAANPAGEARRNANIEALTNKTV